MFGNFVSSLENDQLKKAAAKGLPCPACGVVRFDLAGEAKRLVTCNECGYIASASEWLSGVSAGKRPGRADRPPVGTSIVRHQSGAMTTWEIPPSGRSGGLLFFGWAWTVFVILVGSSVIFGNIGNTVESSKASGSLVFIGAIALALFLIGVGLLYGGYRSKNARYRVTIGGDVMTLRREWRGVKEKSFSISESISVDQVVFYQSNYKPVYGIEIAGRSEKFRFGSSLTPEEKAWLVADIKSVIGQMAQPTAANRLSGKRDVFSFVVPRSGGGFLIGILFCVMSAVVAFLAWKIAPGKEGWSDYSQTILAAMGGLMLIVGIVFLCVSLRRVGTETRLEGSHDQLALRKMKKGMLLSERLFDRAAYHDVRTKDTGHNNGKPMKSIELLIGDRSERLVLWVDGNQAEAFAAELREAMGQSVT